MLYTFSLAATFFFFSFASGKVVNVIYSSITNVNTDRFVDVADLEYFILQEKLDGCNFRLFFDHERNEVSFGSRICLVYHDFRGFYRIKDSLVEKVRKISTYEALNGKSFIIFGELVGYTSRGLPLMPRFKYDFPEKIKFFAFDILILDENNTYLDAETGRIMSLKCENFLEVQEWLKECNFDVIPYEILKAEEYSFDRIKKFKSLLFKHEDLNRTEGNILRVKFKGSDNHKMFKLKPEYFPELKKPFLAKVIKQKKKISADDKFSVNLANVSLDDMKLKSEYLGMNNVMYRSINNFKVDRFNENVTHLEYIILQEKLDGSNLRLIFDHTTNQVSFGSRNNLLDDDEDFRGLHKIKDMLVEKVKKISMYEILNGKNFIIFGELVNYNRMFRFKYGFQEKTVKYFAYDILILDRNNTYVDKDTGKLMSLKLENFVEVQNWLKGCDFDVIPYEILKAEDYSYDKIKEFKSILFNHEDPNRMEGYILRIKYKNNPIYKIYKIKPEMLELNISKEKKLSAAKAVKPKKELIADNKFLDYISKVPYLDDEMKLKPEYIDVCLEEYQKETNARTKGDFIVFFRSLCLYCNERPNFPLLLDKFNAIVSRNNFSNNNNR